MTESSIELLSSWQPIVFLITVLPWAKLLTRQDGLRNAVCIACSFELAGAVLKLIASFSVSVSPLSIALLHIGQIMSAVSGPVAIGAPPLVSALWFEPEERNRSTAIAVLSNNVGNGIAYLAVPLLCAGLGFQSVLFVEVSLACLSFALSWFYLPTPVHRGFARVSESTAYGSAVEGRSEAMDTDAPEPLGVFIQLKMLFSEPSAVLLLVVYAWTSGGAVAWTSMFDQVLPANGYDDILVGQISLWSTVAYVVGGLVSAQVTDRFFPQRMKAVIAVHTVANTVFCVIFALCVQEPILGNRRVFEVDALVVLFLASACGWCSGGAAPAYYELLAEMTYPVSEAVSGNLMSMAENAGSLVMYQVIVRVFGAPAMNAVYAIGLILAVICIMLVDERYAADEAEPLSPLR